MLISGSLAPGKRYAVRPVVVRIDPPCQLFKLRAYLAGRLAVTRHLPELKAANVDLKNSAILQRKIWKEAVEATRESGTCNTGAGVVGNERDD
jgi:hypothetical protein